MSEVSEHAKAALQTWRDNREMTLSEAVQASIDSATAELRRELEKTKRRLEKAESDTMRAEDAIADRDALKREVGEAYAFMQSGDNDAAFDVLKSLIGQGE